MTGPGELGTEESLRPASPRRGQQAVAGLASLGRGYIAAVDTQAARAPPAPWNGPDHPNTAVTRAPRRQAVPTSGRCGRLTPMGCRHKASSLPPQKDVMSESTTLTTPALPRALPEVARRSCCPFFLPQTPTSQAGSSLEQKRGAAMTGEMKKGPPLSTELPQKKTSPKVFLCPYWRLPGECVRLCTCACVFACMYIHALIGALVCVH